ncbi:MAG: xylulose kinase [Spirochaetes bacterium]|nr:xylulose kinase [Spirochaetota bacterium]
MDFVKPFLMGIDAGTGGIRVGIFDRTGNPITLKSRECTTRFPKYGFVEQDPGEWRECLVCATREALSESGVDADDIVAACVDGTSSTVVALDKDGSYLRNAIMWMDHRATAQAKKIFDTGDPALKVCKAGLSAEWFLSKILWLKENEREVYDKTRYFMEQADYITYLLTGIPSASRTHTTHRWFYNSRERAWPCEFYRSIGLEDAIERFPETITGLSEPVGTISKEAAATLGLSPKTIVTGGGTDGYIAPLGSNVLEPGKATLIGGSSHVVVTFVEGTKNIPGMFGSYYDIVIPGLDVIEAGQVSTGTMVKWYKDQFTKSYELEAERAGISHFDLLSKKAADIPIGSEGIIVLDYWQGNRTPYTDYNLQGAIWGLTLKVTPAHVFRAMLEGVAYGTENILRTLGDNGVKIHSLYANGGFVNSELWLKIHADVSNAHVYVLEFPEATIIGSAICAAVGAGVYDSLVDASNSMVRIKHVVEPDRENHEKYQFYFDKYMRTYDAMRDLMHEMSYKQKNQES